MPAAPLTPRLFRYARQKTAALAGNKAHQFAASHALSIYGAAAVYSFIPKNACSTLRFSTAMANGCVAGEADVNWIHHNNATFRASLAELVTARYVFIVLRDPFRRIASCFLDKLVDKRPEGWRYHELTGYATALDDLSFRGFVAGLPAIRDCNIHWRPQSDFAVYEEYDDWFCLEDFAAAVRKLRETIGFEVRDTRHLLRHGADGYKPVTVGASGPDMPGRDIARMKQRGEMPAVADLFDAELIALVRDLYAQDFALYAEKIGRPVLFT